MHGFHSQPASCALDERLIGRRWLSLADFFLATFSLGHLRCLLPSVPVST